MALLAAGAGTWFALRHHGPYDAVQAGPPAAAVTVSPPLARSVAEWTEYTGQFAAIESVELRARVSGYLTEIHFTDGEVVHKGDLLFVIDPRPFEIALQQARAQLETAQAQLDLTTRDVARGDQLRRSDFLAQSTQDQRVEAQRAAAAAVEMAKAAIRAAALNFEFSHVTAPVTGRIGQRLVSVGNLVTGGDNGQATPLTSIVSLDPVWINFDMGEGDYLAFRRAVANGQLQAPDSGRRGDGRVPVQLRLADETGWTREGRLDFIDNQVNRGAGTIRARAVVPNPDGFLTPGQFARLRVPASAAHDALLIPEAAVATDQSRKLVMVVAPDGTVTPRPVRLGPLIDGLRIVRDGIGPADRLVIDGLVRVRPGAKVAPQPGEIRPEPATTLVGASVP